MARNHKKCLDRRAKSYEHNPGSVLGMGENSYGGIEYTAIGNSVPSMVLTWVRSI
jgi:hypothetical protein